MGKRHRKWKSRQGKIKGLDDALDEQMLETVPNGQLTNSDPQICKSDINYHSNKNKQKLNRDQKRNRRQNKGLKQKAKILIKKGILFGDQDDNSTKSSKDARNDQVSILDARQKISHTLAQWHKVTVIDAAKLPRQILFESLLNACSAPFSPICVTIQGKNMTFYLEKLVEANAIKACNKIVIKANTNEAEGMADEEILKDYKLEIRVVPSKPPETTLTPKVIEVIKNVMNLRYRADTKALDLKSFHSDKTFLGEAVYAPLARSAVLNEVMKIIANEISEVEAIDFSDNRIPTLSGFAALAEHAERIRVLYLSDNRLADIAELKKLKRLQHLNELKLDGNLAMEKRFDSHQEFVRAVQKIIPGLQSLNGNTNLPKLISFEDDDDVHNINLPAAQQKMIGGSVDVAMGQLVTQFLEQYFKHFDSEDRHPLEAAYHEEALFSMSVASPSGCASKLSEYQGDVRNLLLIKNANKRNKLLRKGRFSIIDFLAQFFPQTEHNLNSFSLDVPFAAPQAANSGQRGLIGPITITGVFSQGSLKAKELQQTTEAASENTFRHFNRSIILVPQGDGFVIVNDMLLVTIPTQNQIKATLSNLHVWSTQGQDNAFGPERNSNSLKSLVLSLSKLSNMKPEWCEQCLKETGWNLKSAVDAFTLANNQGKIPVEAFNCVP